MGSVLWPGQIGGRIGPGTKQGQVWTKKTWDRWQQGQVPTMDKLETSEKETKTTNTSPSLPMNTYLKADLAARKIQTAFKAKREQSKEETDKLEVAKTK